MTFFPPLLAALMAGFLAACSSSEAPPEARAEAPKKDQRTAPLPTAQARSEGRDRRLFGDWVEAVSGCDSDGVRYSFSRDGSYVTDGELGDWSADGARITLRHEEGVAAGRYSLSNDGLTIQFDDRVATRYVRCAAGGAQPGQAPTAAGAEGGATIEAVTITGDRNSGGSIRIPRVAGIPTDAARRINQVLDRERLSAVRARKECRSSANGRDIHYDLAAEVRYNKDGLLSLRLIGDSFCGGANGTPLYGLRTFDLRTGLEVDVIDATGLAAEALGRMAQPYYSTGTECEAIIAEGSESARVMGAFLDAKGLAIVYRIMFGAGEGCSSVPAIIPTDVVRSRMRLSGPLARAWGETATP
jgi:hypothetical protein